MSNEFIIGWSFYYHCDTTTLSEEYRSHYECTVQELLWTVHQIDSTATIVGIGYRDRTTEKGATEIVN